MASTHMRHLRRRSPPPAAQRGVVLLFSLIALVIMLIAAVALMRSTQSSLFAAGNLAFKRDLQNQSEQAVAQALALFRTTGSTAGPLVTTGSRASDARNLNYSASMLPSNAQGIPTVLLSDDATFAASWTSPDMTPLNSTILPNQIESIRYVIDRLCSAPGDEATLGSTQCVLGDNLTPRGARADNLQGAERVGVSSTSSAANLQSVVYRISIRVIGPRKTESYFQSTFVVPTS